MYSVYKHTSPKGKVYIGITSMNPLKRWNNGRGYKHNSYFYSAIQKYGWENIKHEILFDNLTKEEAEQKEIELIAKYKSNQRGYGYNLTSGGETCVVCIESRKKMSDSHKGIPLSEKHKECLKHGRHKRKVQPNAGKHLSKEWKKHVSESLSKKVCQYDLNGNLINIYNSSVIASKISGVVNSNISRCCNGKLKSAGGFVWRYHNDCA